VTDNAENMESYHHITPIGCAALNLLLKDIMALETMDTREPRKWLDVKSHQVLAALYLTKKSEKNKSTILNLPSNTHWGGVVSPRNGHISLLSHQEEPSG
jgi:hypothetical protein